MAAWDGTAPPSAATRHLAAGLRWQTAGLTVSRAGSIRDTDVTQWDIGGRRRLLQDSLSVRRSRSPVATRPATTRIRTPLVAPTASVALALAALTASVLGLYARWSPDVFLNTKGSTNGNHGHHHDHSGNSFGLKVRSVMIHGAGEFMDMGKFLIIGAMAAAAFKTLLPENIMSLFSGSLVLSITGMMILAILLSICSEADAFVAASFQAFPAGAHLAFVSIGPMVDLKLIGMYAVTFHRRMVLALVFGPSLLIFVLSWLFEHSGLLNGSI